MSPLAKPMPISRSSRSAQSAGASTKVTLGYRSLSGPTPSTPVSRTTITSASIRRQRAVTAASAPSSTRRSPNDSTMRESNGRYAARRDGVISHLVLPLCASAHARTPDSVNGAGRLAPVADRSLMRERRRSLSEHCKAIARASRRNSRRIRDRASNPLTACLASSKRRQCTERTRARRRILCARFVELPPHEMRECWSVATTLHFRRASQIPCDQVRVVAARSRAQSIALAIRVALAISVKVRFFAGSQGNPAPSTTKRPGIPRTEPSARVVCSSSRALIGSVPA